MSMDYGSTFRSANEVFSDLASLDAPLALWRSYKGLLFSQEIKVLEVTPRYVVFGTIYADRVPDVGKKIHLECFWLERPLSACVVGQNPIRARLFLDDFRYCNHAWINRAGQRVQPGRTIYAEIGCAGQEVTAKLVDLSAVGMAFVGNAKRLAQAGVLPGVVVTASFPLSPDLQLKKVPGTVENLSPCSPTLSRFGIRTHPGEILARALQKYVSHRREEILIEMGLG